MSKTILEQFELALDESKIDKATGRVPVQIITPGWGSSGYYSPEVLEAAAPLFKKGTPMYLDHATESERRERPVRSVKEIAASFTKDAKWDGKRLLTEAQLVGPYKDALIALAGTIGVSISGSASDITVGEAEGRTGPIVEGLSAIESVDFVTRAGRGGKILVESAIREHEVLTITEDQAKELGVDEATASDRMSHLRAAVRSAHAPSGGSAWVRDQDAEKSIVWFDVHHNGEPKSFQQSYKVGANDVDVELTGKATEVRAVTQYVPVTRPGSTTPTTEDDQEVTMGNISIEESEHKRLIEEAGRVDALREENTTLKAQNAELSEASAARARTDAALAVITESTKDAGVTFTALEQKGLLGDLPVKEGVLDTAAFKTTVDTAVAEKAAAGGAGSITGFGASNGNGATQVTEADIDKAVAGAFGRPVKEA